MASTVASASRNCPQGTATALVAAAVCAACSPVLGKLIVRDVLNEPWPHVLPDVGWYAVDDLQTHGARAQAEALRVHLGERVVIQRLIELRRQPRPRGTPLFYALGCIYGTDRKSTRLNSSHVKISY